MEIDYKKVVRHLNTLIPKENEGRWYSFSLEKHFDGESDITLIYFMDYGVDNKYRVFHSELDKIQNEDDLILLCLENFKNTFARLEFVFKKTLDNNKDSRKTKYKTCFWCWMSCDVKHEICPHCNSKKFYGK